MKDDLRWLNDTLIRADDATLARIASRVTIEVARRWKARR